MQYIKFEQLIENLEKFELKVDSEFQIACLKRVKSGGDLLILNDKKQEAIIALLSGFVEKIQQSQRVKRLSHYSLALLRKFKFQQMMMHHVF